MMMPQQLQMPPMPAGLSMANFMPRIFFHLNLFLIRYRKILFLASMAGLPFMAPPPGFPPMAFTGPRYWSFEQCMWVIHLFFFPFCFCPSDEQDTNWVDENSSSLFHTFCLNFVAIDVFLFSTIIDFCFTFIQCFVSFVSLYKLIKSWKRDYLYIWLIIYLSHFSRLLTCE